MNNTQSMETLEQRFLLSIAAGDFNGDGRDDLAMGVPFEDLSDEQGNPNVLENAGVVHVIYGTSQGTSAEGNQLWQLRSAGVKGDPLGGDKFGNAMATGDFNSDGFDDLAIGMDERTVGGEEQAGAILVLYGSADGLTATGDRLFTQNTKGILGTAGEFDHFGIALTSGDFDDDGFDDLAISVPVDDVEGVSNAGAVQVLYGSENGIGPQRDQIWNKNIDGIPGSALENDFWGIMVAAGDFDNDGRDDLAIGNPLADLGSVVNAGTVQVLYGRESTGLGIARDQLLSQNSSNVAGNPEVSDQFGHSLAVSDFDNDGFDDLAVVARGEDGGAGPDAYVGAVQLFFGSDQRLVGDGNAITRQDYPDIHFETPIGEDITAGDFNGDGFGDLIIGIAGDYVAAASGAGSLVAIYGSADGLDLLNFKHWSQDIDELNATAEEFDTFAQSLCAGDFDGNNRDDLAVAVPRESIELPTAISRVGGVHVIYGFIEGLIAPQNQFWTQDSLGIPGEGEADDRFGDYVHFLQLL